MVDIFGRKQAAAEAADYERVNGAADRARAAEVKAFGPRGFGGDPGTDAAEARADRQMDATGSWKVAQERGRALGAAQASAPAAQQAKAQGQGQ